MFIHMCNGFHHRLILYSCYNLHCVAFEDWLPVSTIDYAHAQLALPICVMTFSHSASCSALHFLFALDLTFVALKLHLLLFFNQA